MNILPVIDLLGGQVVRAVAGRRSEYLPIDRSVLAGTAAVEDVGRAFVEHLGVDEIYLADLDAIQGAEPAWNPYDQLIACGLSLWIDAGLDNVRRANEVARYRAGYRAVAGVIAGLESVPGPELLAALLDRIGDKLLVFSLDLVQGQPKTDSAEWSGMTPADILGQALQLGVRRFILLDLAGVGTGGGATTADLCRQLRECAADVQIVSGGGVRHAGDLATLAESGCDAALVASALHNGTITRAHIQKIQQIQETTSASFVEE